MPLCPTPRIGLLIPSASTSMILNQRYEGKVTITNATSATITSLPTASAGWTIVPKTVGSNLEITISGTPTTGSQAYTIMANVINAATGCDQRNARASIGAGFIISSGVEPIVNLVNPNIFVFDTPYTGQITVRNATSVQNVVGLPSGITVLNTIRSGNDTIVNLTGRPTTALQTYTITLTAINQSPTNAYATITKTGMFAGTGRTQLKACLTPSVGTITPTEFKFNTDYNGSISIQNATSATLSGLPAGINIKDTVKVGTGLQINLTGKPTQTGQSYSILVNATNELTSLAGPLCEKTSVTNQQAGQGTIGSSNAVSPVVQPLTPNSLVQNTQSMFQKGTQYRGTITVKNATSVSTITGIPAGITYTTAVNLQDVIVTLSGTPTGEETTEIRVTATNAPSGFQATTVNSVLAWAGKVSANVCPTPTVSTISPNVFQKGIRYTGSLTVSNVNPSSSIVISGLPEGIIETPNGRTTNGTTVTVTFSGTPSTTMTKNDYIIRVSASNTGNTCSISKLENANAGSGVVSNGDCPAPVRLQELVTDQTSEVPSTTTYNNFPAIMQIGKYYKGTIIVGPATSALWSISSSSVSETGRLAVNSDQNIFGLKATGEQVGANYKVTIAGTPTHSHIQVGINVIATNAPVGCISKTAVISGNSTKFAIALGACLTPALKQNISNTTLKIGTLYTTTVIYSNATSATVDTTTLPPGLTTSTVKNGTDLQITFRGTPTTAGSFTPKISVFNEITSGTSQCSRSSLTNQTLSQLTVGADSVSVEPINPNLFSPASTYNGSIVVRNVKTVGTVSGLPTGVVYKNMESVGTNAFKVNFTGVPTVPGQQYNITVSPTDIGGTVRSNLAAGSGSVVGMCPTPTLLPYQEGAFVTAETMMASKDVLIGLQTVNVPAPTSPMKQVTYTPTRPHWQVEPLTVKSGRTTVLTVENCTKILINTSDPPAGNWVVTNGTPNSIITVREPNYSTYNRGFVTTMYAENKCGTGVNWSSGNGVATGAGDAIVLWNDSTYKQPLVSTMITYPDSGWIGNSLPTTIEIGKPYDGLIFFKDVQYHSSTYSHTQNFRADRIWHLGIGLTNSRNVSIGSSNSTHLTMSAWRLQTSRVALNSTDRNSFISKLLPGNIFRWYVYVISPTTDPVNQSSAPKRNQAMYRFYLDFKIVGL